MFFLFVSTFFLIIFSFKEEVVLKANKDSGFYFKPFNFILNTNLLNYEIRYTFDGSQPTPKSNLFKNKILITGNESYNNLSYIKTTIADSISRFPEKWVKPLGNQDKATVIKYAAFKNGEIKTKVFTKTFFIHYPYGINYFHNKAFHQNLYNYQNTLVDYVDNQKYNLPVISISTDYKNLFCDSLGLFVAGDATEIDNKHSGNFFERGMKYERIVYLQYFDENMNLDFEMNLGMRIHGGVSRRFPQKSIKFYKRKHLDKSKIKLPFLSDKRVKRFLLEGMQESGGGRALIEDIVAQEIVKDLGFEQQSSNPVIVFINGEYWGLYTLRDRLDEHYLSYKFDLHRDSFDLIDGHSRRKFKAIHGDNSDFLELLDFIKSNDISIAKNYDYVCSKIDIKHVIDYFSVQIFFANLDWPIHNIKIWKKKKNGKWRFLLYDVDGGFSHKTSKDLEEDHLKDMFKYLLNDKDCGNKCKNPPKSTLLFRGLSQNITFKKEFQKRHKEIISKYFNYNKTQLIVDSIANIYEPYIGDHIKRWGFPKNKRYWESQIDSHIKYFLKNREEATLKNLDNYIIEK